MRKIINLISLIILSCGTKQNLPLSDLIIKNENADYLIENRIPKYGIDGREGDVRAISMNIPDLRNNFINGRVFDSVRNEPLVNAYIELYLKSQDKEDTLGIYSDINGSFEKEFEGTLRGLKIYYVGYRYLKVNLEKQKNTAHNKI